MTCVGPPRAPARFGPSNSSARSLMRALMSACRCSVPLCLGIVRSISRNHSRRSRGSRALRKAASAALYSGLRLAGIAKKPLNLTIRWVAIQEILGSEQASLLLGRGGPCVLLLLANITAVDHSESFLTGSYPASNLWLAARSDRVVTWF